MLGVIVNTITVLVGSTIGMLAKKAIPREWTDLMFKGIALCVLCIGITGCLEGENTLVMILSMAVGAIIGAALDLDRHINNLAEKLENRFKKEKEDEKATIAEGFVSASLLFCVGAMTIVGSLQAGLTGDNQMLFTKATLDGISSVIFAASFGIGVIFSAAFVLVFQGAIVMLARLIEPLLATHIISEMTCVGSLLIIAMGLNMLGVTKFKAMNYTPAIFMPMIIYPLYDLLGGLI